MWQGSRRQHAIERYSGPRDDYGVGKIHRGVQHPRACKRSRLAARPAA